MGRIADSERVAFWRELVERRRRRGLSVAGVCAEAGVSTASFYLWQRKLRGGGVARPRDRSDRREAPRLVPVRILADAAPGRGDSTVMLEVELPGKIQLRIPPGFDVPLLQAVLSVLLPGGGREAGGC